MFKPIQFIHENKQWLSSVWDKIVNVIVTYVTAGIKGVSACLAAEGTETETKFFNNSSSSTI